MIPVKISEADFQEIDFLGRKMLCSSFRIDRASIPHGLYAYDVRHSDDDWGLPCQLQERVLVNHFGTIITDEPIQLEQDLRGVKFLDFDGNNDFEFTDHATVWGEDVEKYFEKGDEEDDEEVQEETCSD